MAILKEHYSMSASATEKDPFRLLVTCLLSLRTKDENTKIAAQIYFVMPKHPATSEAASECL